jgi:tripartite ATP-independent transporter DctP family solute receptor
MRNVVRAVLLVCVIGLLGLDGGARAETKLKWAHVYETSEPFHKSAVWAAEQIKTRTNGRYVIDVFPASTLGKESDINQGLMLGTVDIIWTGTPFAARSYGPAGIGSASYMFRDFDHWRAYRDSALFQELADGYGKKTGNKIAALAYYGERHVTSNKPINKPEDMKGLKIRVPDAPLYLMFPRAVGANPTPIAFAEVYLALQNGTVDAQENPLPTIEAKKFYEVQKYISLTGHLTDGILAVIGGPTWSKLSEDDRKLFEAVLKEAGERCTKDVREAEARLVDQFQKRGKTVLRVDRKPFRDAVAKVHLGPEATWSKDVYDRLQALK